MADRLFRLRQVLAVTGVGSSTIYRLIEKGSFPAQVRVGPGCVAWRESDINAWMDSVQEKGQALPGERRADAAFRLRFLSYTHPRNPILFRANSRIKLWLKISY